MKSDSKFYVPYHVELHFVGVIVFKSFFILNFSNQWTIAAFVILWCSTHYFYPTVRNNLFWLDWVWHLFLLSFCQVLYDIDIRILTLDLVPNTRSSAKWNISILVCVQPMTIAIWGSEITESCEFLRIVMHWIDIFW